MKNDHDISLRLLGRPWIKSVSEKAFPNKGFALLAALLLSSVKELSRAHVASLLWENVDQQAALANLRQLLVRMQRAQRHDYPLIEPTPTGIRAGSGAFASDLHQFLTACGADDGIDRQQSLRLMGGELLAGIEADGEFSIWLLSERARLKDHFFDLAAAVLNGLTRYGHSRRGEITALADHILGIEPDREESYGLVIGAYARVGDAEAINRVHDRFQQLLKAEKRPPSNAIAALVRRFQSELSRQHVTQVPKETSKPSKPRVAFRLPSRADGRPAGPLTISLVEDVANSLSRYRTFAVIAPHSSFAPGNLTESLAVDYRVHSTILPGDRISFALVDDRTFEIAWSAEFAFKADQLQAIFGRLSKQIAATLASQIERYFAETITPFGSGAYLDLLRGQQLLKKCDLGLLRRARSHFRKATEEPATLATARGRIAQTLQLEWLMLGGQDPYLLQRGKAEAEAAVEADSASGIGHWMCAVIALYQRDYETSAQKFLDAEALSPNSADLLLQHADALAHFGEPFAAWAKFQDAVDLNPLAPDIYWWAGASIAFDLQNYDEAVALCGRMENDEPALRVLTASYALAGDIENARTCAERLMENYPSMTAREIAGLSPDKNVAANENFYHGLKLAGVK